MFDTEANRLLTAPALFSRTFIPSLDAQIESQENWTPAQSGRLDWVFLASLAHRILLLAPASLGFSLPCVNREAASSLRGKRKLQNYPI